MNSVDWPSSLLHAITTLLQNMFRFPHIFRFFFVFFRLLDSWQLGVGVFIELIASSMECRLFALNYNNKTGMYSAWIHMRLFRTLRVFDVRVCEKGNVLSIFTNRWRHSSRQSLIPHGLAREEKEKKKKNSSKIQSMIL